MKFVSCILSIVIILQMTVVLFVTAETEDINEKIVIGNGVPITLNAISSQEWAIAYKDGITDYAWFHRILQSYFVSIYAPNMKMELGVKDGGWYGDDGKIDLVLPVTDNKITTTYIWDVKPSTVYHDTYRLNDAKLQLANYIKMYPKARFEDINKAGNEYEFDIPYEGECPAVTPLGVKYTICYQNTGNGLIFYRFNREKKDDEEEKKEKAASLPAYNAAAQEAYNRSWEEQLNASSSQSPSESLDEIYVNSDGDVVDNSGNIIYTATRLALYYTVATTLQAYYRLVNKSMNPTSESIVGEPICTAAKVQITMIKTSKYISSTQKVAGFIAAMAAMEPFIEAYDISAEEIEDDPEKINEILEDIKEKNSSFNNAAKAQPPRDPLIIDLGKQGIELTTLDNGVNFDIDNNTFAEKTAWIGLEDGFLVLDRNENGKIDNGGELFGDQVILKSGLKSTSGFEALMEFDENKDGVIDKKDAIYSSLKVWIDENQNGISE